MRLFNTLTNKKEEFKPIEEGKVSIYICGPTVYNHAHIGNTRPMIVFDVLRRTFEYLGNDVTFVSNYTDVDDKIIKAAKAEGITEKELTDKYIKAYEDVRVGLNIEDPTYKPRVTETMPEIIDFIQALIDKGYAYEVDGDVYFRVTKVKEYGMLSGIKVEDLIAGASDRTLSVDDKKKESTTDFALWKKTDEGIQFDTPWSKGRPGWHTECVVMINKLFKDGKIDIHGGGQDLKFPHHENEIAQSMALYNNAIANYWIHNARIDLSGEKMSKSLGNVVWLKDIVNMYPPQAYRLFVLNNHYRQTINYSEEMMNKMVNEWNKIEKAYISLYRNLDLKGALNKQEVLPIMDDFLNEMAYDFNTANAVTALYSHIKNINKDLRNASEDVLLLQKDLATFDAMLYVLGLKVDVKPLTEEEKELVNKWNLARKNKDFDTADTLRQEIVNRGIVL